MAVAARAIFRGSVGFVAGAAVGVIGFMAVVLAFDLVGALLSFVTGLSLPEIIVGEPLTSEAGQWVLPTGVLRIVGLLGAVAGVIWRLAGPAAAFDGDAS